MSSHLTVEVKNGKSYVKFVPDAKMYSYAMARALPENLSKKDQVVCESISLPYATLKRWRTESNPYFDEWVENYILTNSGGLRLLKRMLEDVGNKKALEGDFNFWKALAIKHGIIQADQTNLNVIPANLGAYDTWDQEKISTTRDSLLQALRPMADEGGSGMADATSEGGPEGDSHGISPLSPEPVALPAELGAHGERAREEPEPDV